MILHVCRNCRVPMVGSMTFYPDKNGDTKSERYYLCEKCHDETKHKDITNFDSILHKEMEKNSGTQRKFADRPVYHKHKLGQA